MAAKKRTTSTTPDNRSEAEKRDEARKQFVAQKKAQGVSVKEANTQFYVQTRVKELTAKGVTVDAAKRKELRQNYESGNVKRAGFGVTPVTGGAANKSNNNRKTPALPARMGRESTSFTGSTKPTRIQSAPDRMNGPRRNQTVPDRLASSSAPNKGKGGLSGFISGVDRNLRAANPVYGSNRDYIGNIVSAASKGKNIGDSSRKAVVAKLKQDAILLPAIMSSSPILIGAKGAYESIGRLGVPLPGYKKNKKR